MVKLIRQSFPSLGYTLEYAPCYNGNIARRTWAEGSYAYTYDALNRLSSAVFTPAEELADRPAVERDRTPDFSVYYDYDRRGNTTNVVRYGVVDAVSDFDRVESFGTLDELACSYEGNQLCNIRKCFTKYSLMQISSFTQDVSHIMASQSITPMRWDSGGHCLYWNC